MLDLNHGLQFTPVASVIGSDDIEVLRDSDVIVTTAGAKQRPGQTRMDLAATNVAMMQSLMKQCMSVAPDALHLVVTNPCDVVTYAALKASGLPPSRVFGSGTVLDSSRFRYLLAQHAGVAVQNVHGYVLGEHGDSEIAIWSRANIGMVPIDEYVGASGVALDETGKQEIFDQVVNAAYEIIEGKGATWYAVGLAVTRIVEAVLHDESRVLPEHLPRGIYKGSATCLSVPCVVNRNGVERILDVPMSDAELGGLRASADQVRGRRALGFDRRARRAAWSAVGPRGERSRASYGPVLSATGGRNRSRARLRSSVPRDGRPRPGLWTGCASPIGARVLPCPSFETRRPFTRATPSPPGSRPRCSAGRFRRIFRGVYVEARVPDHPLVRARPRAPPSADAFVSHVTAARVRGCPCPSTPTSTSPCRARRTAARDPASAATSAPPRP